MKVHIYFELKNSAWGGGNQFLKALKNYFIKNKIYEEDYIKSDVILFNSHHNIEDIIKIKLMHPNKIFVHRVDGPMMYYRDGNPKLDLFLFYINEKLSDGTIFQSKYSMNACKKLGLKNNIFETIITNAPDSNIFNSQNRVMFSKKRKIRLVATSWSANWKKGFDVYQWLDNNLDFNKYNMKFIGNSPIEFKNIEYIPPMDSVSLSKELKQNDIFIFASKIESCSNSLLEGIHSGLPTIAYNSTGNIELVEKCGETFSNAEEIPSLLEKIVNNYENYQNNTNLPTIDEVGKMYYEFLEMIYKKQQNDNYRPKQFSSFDYWSIKKTLFVRKCSNTVKGLNNRIKGFIT